MGTVSLGLVWQSIQLVPDGTLLFHIFLIVFMVWVLNRTLFKPINRILEQREFQTRGLMESAQTTLSDVEKKLSEYEQSLRAARAEGYKALEMQRAEALRDREGQVAIARTEIVELASNEKQNINQQLEEARKTLSASALRIGLEIGSRILGRPLKEP